MKGHWLFVVLWLVSITLVWDMADDLGYRRGTRDTTAIAIKAIDGIAAKLAGRCH